MERRNLTWGATSLVAALLIGVIVAAMYEPAPVDAEVPGAAPQDEAADPPEQPTVGPVAGEADVPADVTTVVSSEQAEAEFVVTPEQFAEASRAAADWRARVGAVVGTLIVEPAVSGSRPMIALRGTALGIGDTIDIDGVKLLVVSIDRGSATLAAEAPELGFRIEDGTALEFLLERNR